MCKPHKFSTASYITLRFNILTHMCTDVFIYIFKILHVKYLVTASEQNT